MWMRRAALAVLLVVSLSGGQARAGPAGHVANLKKVAGTVTVTRGGATVDAEPGMQLWNGDSLGTGPHGRAGIVFLDGTTMGVGPSSRLVIERFAFEPGVKRYDFSLFLERGETLFSTGKIGKLAPEAVELRTPTATIGVRGTRFIVEVD